MTNEVFQFDLNRKIPKTQNTNENKFNIGSVFSTPIYRAQLDYKISEKDNNNLNKIIETKDVKIKEGKCTQSKDVFVFDTFFQKLKEEILIHLNNYIEKIHNPAEEFKIKITQSWLNFYNNQQSIHEHNHPNSFISGGYYFKTRKEDVIVFRDKNFIERYGFQFKLKEITKFNQENIVAKVEEGILMLFPSSVNHYVSKFPRNKWVNEDSDKIVRISLSVNTYISGYIGSIDNLTFLEL